MKIYIGVFAHPDDEAYGPGGTFAMWAAQTDSQAHVITATKGELGGDPGVGDERTSEMIASGKALGLESHTFLGFIDGELSNSKYHKIADEIAEAVSELVDEDTELTLVTFDRTGLTGHLDHIAISLITSHVFAHRDTMLPKTKSAELLYFCVPDSQRPKADSSYFVLSPAGYPNEEIDIINDVNHKLDVKLKAIRAHQSQKPEEYIKSAGESLKKEHFIIAKDIE